MRMLQNGWSEKTGNEDEENETHQSPNRPSTVLLSILSFPWAFFSVLYHLSYVASKLKVESKYIEYHNLPFPGRILSGEGGGVKLLRSLEKIVGLVNTFMDRDSDWLRAGRSGDRILVVARLSAPVQTGPGARPVSYTMGTGSFPGVKRLDRGVDHRPHQAPKLKKE